MLEQYNDILRVEDVAEALMIGRNRVYELINSNEIKSMRIGRNIKIPKECVIEYIRNKSGLK